ncbi:GNAT family N-acetyltransferase [Microbacterium sp. NPDC090007]|uniref:GNAT family N-acetyltransferase n=1 Tax=Microbacterium sp. NPDC090007 TaxID=3364204 RepID=UPI003820BC4D
MSESLYSSLRWNNAFAEPNGHATLHVSENYHEVEGWVISHLLSHRTSNAVYDAPSIMGDLAEGAPEMWYPQLLVGARNGQYNPANLPRRDVRALESLFASLRQIESSSMAWLYADTQTAELVIGSDDAFIPVLSELDCSIPVHFDDFDGYLGGLSSKLRYGVRRDLRQSEGMPAWEMVDEGSADLLAACAPLAVQTQSRHGASSTVEGMLRYLTRCVSAADASIIFYYGPRANPVAFSLALVEAGRLWVRLVGLDYGPAGDTSGRYPGVLVYGPVSYAAEHGLRHISVGAGNSTYKRHRGAEVEPRWSLLRPPQGVAVHRGSVTAHNERRAMELGLEPGSGTLHEWHA